MASSPARTPRLFGGNPFATAAALYVQRAIDELGLLDRTAVTWVRYLGFGMLLRLARAAPAEELRGARGAGSCRGWSSRGTRPIWWRACAGARPVGSRVAGTNVVRLVPPLVVTRPEIDEAIEILDAVLEDTVTAHADCNDRVPSDFALAFDGSRRLEGIEALIRRAEELRALRVSRRRRTPPGQGACWGWCSEKASTRTRASFGDRHVRARRPRALLGHAGLPAGTRRAAARHGPRPLRLLPRHHGAHLRSRPRRGDVALRDGAGHQRPHRSDAPLSGARRPADGRAAVRRRQGDVPADVRAPCARSATPGSATATTWPTPGSRRPAF